MHLVLLGDSTIDNQNYTKGELSVEGHLRRSALVGAITRFATDGHTTSHIPKQLERLLLLDATHLLLSVGGNLPQIGRAHV